MIFGSVPTWGSGSQFSTKTTGIIPNRDGRGMPSAQTGFSAAPTENPHWPGQNYHNLLVTARLPGQSSPATSTSLTPQTRLLQPSGIKNPKLFTAVAREHQCCAHRQILEVYKVTRDEGLTRVHLCPFSDPTEKGVAWKNSRARSYPLETHLFHSQTPRRLQNSPDDNARAKRVEVSPSGTV